MTTSSKLKSLIKNFLVDYNGSIMAKADFSSFMQAEMEKSANLIFEHAPYLPNHGEMILVTLSGITWAVTFDPMWQEMTQRSDAIFVYPVVTIEDCVARQETGDDPS